MKKLNLIKDIVFYVKLLDEEPFFSSLNKKDKIRIAMDLIGLEPFYRDSESNNFIEKNLNN